MSEPPINPTIRPNAIVNIPKQVVYEIGYTRMNDMIFMFIMTYDFQML